MTKRILRPINIFSLLCAVMVITACSASGPATTYYGFTENTTSSDASAAAALNVTVGIGPVILPGYLDNPAVISRKSGNRVNVSGYHAWAEPLDEGMARIIASNVSNRIQQSTPYAFPWDSRDRPDWQIKIKVEKFDGVRGDVLMFTAQWTAFSLSDSTLVMSGRETISLALDSPSYENYVQVMNEALVQFSETLADKLVGHDSSDP